MLMVQSAILALTRSAPNSTPRDVLCLANEVLYGNIRTRLEKDDHVTFTLLRYTTDGAIVFAGAHEDILIRRRSTGRVDCIRPPGTWLGARPDVRRVTVDSLLRLEDGDVMVLYTDGITEARNARREQFDLDRLVALVESCGEAAPEAIRDRILDAVRRWMAVQDDDISVVVARYCAPQR